MNGPSPPDRGVNGFKYPPPEGDEMIVTGEHDFGEENSFSDQDEQIFRGLDEAKLAEIFWNSPMVMENLFVSPNEVWFFSFYFHFSNFHRFFSFSLNLFQSNKYRHFSLEEQQTKQQQSLHPQQDQQLPMLPPNPTNHQKSISHHPLQHPHNHGRLSRRLLSIKWVLFSGIWE